MSRWGWIVWSWRGPGVVRTVEDGMSVSSIVQIYSLNYIKSMISDVYMLITYFTIVNAETTNTTVTAKLTADISTQHEDSTTGVRLTW